ncbi:unnamed protein product, partial [Mesorhabditis belari]|uniref:SCP domain-containing protein n=1 Tax=Mesorhabditis belari TaxID=2138241 RepID=A0AAF3EP94_9BILA
MPSQDFDLIDYMGPVVVGILFSVISFFNFVFINFFCITKTDDITVFEKFGAKYNMRLGPHSLNVGQNVLLTPTAPHIWAAHAMRCTCQYQLIDSGANTMCSGSPAQWTDVQRSLMLQWHNQLRSSLTKGKENYGIANGITYAPSTKRMTKISITAQSGSMLTRMLHTVFGLFQMGGRKAQEWEKILIKILIKGVGHYTQMARQETTAVGCGIAHCPTMTCVVRQHYPT